MPRQALPLSNYRGADSINLHFITGTTKGLGKALAEQLAGDPANEVVTFSRRADGIANARHYDLDLAATERIAAVFATALKECRERSYAAITLYNNAGVVAPVGPLAACDPMELDANIRVNLTAPLILMRAFIGGTAGMSAKRLVVNISSGASKRPVPGWTAYCTSKAGLDMATRVAALETEDPGLVVCSLAPGVVDTPMQAQVRGASEADFPDVARFKAMKEEGALRPPSDVAAAILGLAEAGRLENGGIHDIREMVP